MYAISIFCRAHWRLSALPPQSRCSRDPAGAELFTPLEFNGHGNLFLSSQRSYTQFQEEYRDRLESPPLLSLLLLMHQTSHSLWQHETKAVKRPFTKTMQTRIARDARLQLASHQISANVNSHSITLIAG